MGAVNYWSKRLNHSQGPFCGCRTVDGSTQRETEGRENCFHHLGTGTRREEEGERTYMHTHTHTGPIGSQTLRVSGSIWKATLCLALYCTPCCFNQWQACSQSLERPSSSLSLSHCYLHFSPHHCTATLSAESPKSRTAIPKGLDAAVSETVSTLVL